MSKVYICAFDESKTLSYYHDWRDAFERNGFTIINLDIINTKYDLLRFAPWLLKLVPLLFEKHDLIIVGYSIYYALGKKRRGLLSWFLRQNSALKVVLLENEYRLLDDKIRFANMCNASYVTTQMPVASAEKLYSNLTKAKVYPLPHALNPNIFKPVKSLKERVVDIGMRSAEYPWYLGDLDRNKTVEFIHFLKSEKRFNVDVSSAEERRFTRIEWADFLNNARCTIATEAGAAFVEVDDHTRLAVNAYLEKNVNATFADVYDQFFANYKNPISGKCISSRHFDAIGTKTCQILLEGDYNGVLVPGKHYVELKKDFLNIEEVVQVINDDEKIQNIADCAYNYVLENHTHDHRVKDLLNAVLPVS